MIRRIGIAAALLAGGAMAALAGGHAAFVGVWAATQGGQTIAWELREDGAALFTKDGAPAGAATWEAVEGGVVIRVPPGDFTGVREGDALRLTPPPAIGGPPALFERRD